MTTNPQPTGRDLPDQAGLWRRENLQIQVVKLSKGLSYCGFEGQEMRFGIVGGKLDDLPRGGWLKATPPAAPPEPVAVDVEAAIEAAAKDLACHWDGPKNNMQSRVDRVREIIQGHCHAIDQEARYECEEAISDHKFLVKYFRDEESTWGKTGDDSGWSPAETVVQLVRDLKHKIEAMKYKHFSAPAPAKGEEAMVSELKKLAAGWKRAADEEQRSDEGPRVMLQCANELLSRLPHADQPGQSATQLDAKPAAESKDAPTGSLVVCPDCKGKTIPGDGTWGCDTCEGEGKVTAAPPTNSPGEGETPREPLFCCHDCENLYRQGIKCGLCGHSKFATEPGEGETDGPTKEWAQAEIARLNIQAVQLRAELAAAVKRADDAFISRDYYAERRDEAVKERDHSRETVQKLDACMDRVLKALGYCSGGTDSHGAVAAIERLKQRAEATKASLTTLRLEEAGPKVIVGDGRTKLVTGRPYYTKYGPSEAWFIPSGYNNLTSINMTYLDFGTPKFPAAPASDANPVDQSGGGKP